jgi:hypothetical protein
MDKIEIENSLIYSVIEKCKILIINLIEDKMIKETIDILFKILAITLAYLLIKRLIMKLDFYKT